MNDNIELFDVEAVRRDFPLIDRHASSGKWKGAALAYLDNAASAQKPACVIDAISRFYSEDYANIHRGVHALSQRATDAYENAREKVRSFINAREAAECIFVRNATEGVNLVASSFARERLQSTGSNVVITAMEHHANIVPWQMAMRDSGAQLRVAPVGPDGVLDVSAFDSLIDENTVIVGLSHVSNVLGTINPVREIIAKAHAKGVPVLLDAAQSAPHVALDVQELGCDFLVFSGHKVYGPSGIGVLYGRRRLLESMPPYQGGGDMIASVSFARTTFRGIPERFEAGTPSLADAIGLAAALDYISSVGVVRMARHEKALLEHATELVGAIPGVRIIGTAPHKAAVLSFVMEGVHPHDIGTFLDAEAIAIRAGHHCAEPLMRVLGLPGTARASFALYNTHEEVVRLAEGVGKISHFFR